MSFAYLDTSALAKWYLNEAASNEVETFIQSEGVSHISSLTRVELRCMLSRRHRAREISADTESMVYTTFEQDVADGYLVVDEVQANHFDDAVRLIGTLPKQPLRCLDALHLAIMRHEGLDRLATADNVMADAGRELGFEVISFHAK